jgi:Fe-S-cluster containining protein
MPGQAAGKIVVEVNISDNTGANITGSDFPCFCCGICCSDFQPHLDLREAQKIADNLGMSLRQFYDDCTDPRWPGVDTHLIRHVDGMCLFLERKEGKAKWLCRIHAFKPDACLEWAAGPEKKQCQKGLSRFWGLSVDHAGNLTGTPEDLECFQDFVKTLD